MSEKTPEDSGVFHFRRAQQSPQDHHFPHLRRSPLNKFQNLLFIRCKVRNHDRLHTAHRSRNEDERVKNSYLVERFARSHMVGKSRKILGGGKRSILRKNGQNIPHLWEVAKGRLNIHQPFPFGV